MRKISHIFILFLLVILNSCSLTFQGFMDYFNYSKTGVDFISYTRTDKTTSDHALSYLFGKDCSLPRALKLQSICKEINKDHGYKNRYKKEFLTETKILKIQKNKVSQAKKIIKVPSMAYDIK